METNHNKDIQDLLNSLENENSEAAENHMQALYADAPREFSSGFADRVMEGIAETPPEQGMDYFLPRLFRWVAVTGAAAAIGLLLMTYIAEDSLSVDALAGLSELSVTDVIALNE